MDLSQVVSQELRRRFEESVGINEAETEEIEKQAEVIYRTRFSAAKIVFDFPAPKLEVWLRSALDAEDISILFDENGELVAPAKICYICRQIVSLFAFKMNVANAAALRPTSDVLAYMLWLNEDQRKSQDATETRHVTCLLRYFGLHTALTPHEIAAFQRWVCEVYSKSMAELGEELYFEIHLIMRNYKVSNIEECFLSDVAESIIEGNLFAIHQLYELFKSLQ